MYVDGICCFPPPPPGAAWEARACELLAGDTGNTTSWQARFLTSKDAGAPAASTVGYQVDYISSLCGADFVPGLPVLRGKDRLACVDLIPENNVAHAQRRKYIRETAASFRARLDYQIVLISDKILFVILSTAKIGTVKVHSVYAKTAADRGCGDCVGTADRAKRRPIACSCAIVRRLPIGARRSDVTRFYIRFPTISTFPGHSRARGGASLFAVEKPSGLIGRSSS